MICNDELGLKTTETSNAEDLTDNVNGDDNEDSEGDDYYMVNHSWIVCVK